jgi:hypothetical protein
MRQKPVVEKDAGDKALTGEKAHAA